MSGHPRPDQCHDEQSDDREQRHRPHDARRQGLDPARATTLTITDSDDAATSSTGTWTASREPNITNPGTQAVELPGGILRFSPRHRLLPPADQAT